MGRPPTAIGTYGHIHVAMDGEQWRAETRFRMADGTLPRVRRWRNTKAKAINAVKAACTELANEIRGGEISGDTRFKRVAAMWVEELERRSAEGGLSPSTVELRQSTLRNWVLPKLGELTMREVTVERCDKAIQAARVKSYATASHARTAIRGVCVFAARHGAIQVDPTKSTGRLSSGGRKEVKALTLEQRMDLFGKLDPFLRDLMEAMLATGVRIGELLAIIPDQVDLSGERPKVTIDHHVVRVKGVGMVRVPLRKGNGEGLRLGTPVWSAPMWRRRVLQSGGGPLFPSVSGTWMNQSVAGRTIKAAMEEAGYGWVTSHVWRKTVATVLDEAGLPTTAIADQLGNTPAIVERHYRKKRETNQAAVAALEGMMEAQ